MPQNDDYMTTFLKTLSDKELELDEPTPRDGNCFFWAVCFALNKLDPAETARPTEMREKTIKYMKDQTDEWKNEKLDFMKDGMQKSESSNATG